MCLYILYWILSYCFEHTRRVFKSCLVCIFNKYFWHDIRGHLSHSMCLLRSFIKARKQGSFWWIFKIFKTPSKNSFFYYGFSKHSNSIDYFIWNHSISKLASLIYTYISYNFHSSCWEIAKGTTHAYSWRLVKHNIFYLLPIFIDKLYQYEFIRLYG